MSEDHLYCRKEKEIAEMHTDIRHLKRIVMEGNGGEALATSVPRLSHSVEILNEKTIPDLQTGISAFLKYQNEESGIRKGQQSVRKRDRWLIGILVTALGITIGGLITLVVVVL